MTTSAAQASAFFREVLREGRVWAIRDGGGFPAPLNHDGARVMPFWSLESRAQRVVDGVAAYAGFEVVDIELPVWRESWLAGLRRDGLMVGINWSGRTAMGYDLTVEETEARLGASE